MLKKNEYAKKFLEKTSIFICPKCHSKLELENNTLKCSFSHTFDISKKGYVFLVDNSLYKPSKIYDYNLFENRRNFIKLNFYDEIYKIIAKRINAEFNSKICILDLGCGESTHSKKIQNKIDIKNILLGTDYSKTAIELSSDYNDNNNFYFIGDVNNLPLRENSVDVVVDFLSPYNSEEISRVLKKHSLFIKVVPGKNYLSELRKEENLKEYNKELEIKDNLKKHFELYEEINYKKTFNINEEQKNFLVNMTPLKKKEGNNIDTFQNITIDMNIYFIRFKEDEYK